MLSFFFSFKIQLSIFVNSTDFNQSNDSSESPDLWLKPFSPSPSVDDETEMKTPDKIPNGVFTPLTDEDKQCDSPQHLNVFIQPVSDNGSITEKLPESTNPEEVQSNPIDISDEWKSEDRDINDADDNNDDLNFPKAQENIPDDNISVNLKNYALNPNDGCDIDSVNWTEGFNDKFRTSENFNDDSNDDKQDDCEFSDFADFTSVTVKDEEIVKNENSVPEPVPVSVSIPIQNSSFNEDDFDDFEDFECADFEPSKEVC